jgi:hypothetical protein
LSRSEGVGSQGSAVDGPLDTLEARCGNDGCGGCLPLPDDELLEPEETDVKCLLKVVPHGSLVDGDGRMQPDLYDRPHHVMQLHVHAPRVEMAAHRVDGLFRLQPPVHCHKAVGYQEETNRRVSAQTMNEGFAGHTLDASDEVTEPDPMHGVDSLEESSDLTA